MKRELERYVLRIRQELDCPTKRPFKLLRRLGVRRWGAHTQARRRLDFIYDLGCNAISFDFIYRLLMAEAQRQASGLSYIRLVVVRPSIDTPYVSAIDYAQHVTQRDIDRRLHHIVLQTSALCRSITEVVVCHRDNLPGLFLNDATVFPEGYSPQRPVSCPTLAEWGKPLPGFDIPEQSLSLVSEYLARFSKPVVTITLRSYGYIPGRNSNMEGWRAAAAAIAAAGYDVVVLPDLLHAELAVSNSCWGFEVPGFCSFDLINRAALYRLAFLNLGVGSGPLMLSFFDQASKCLMFHRLPEVEYAESILKSQGDWRYHLPYIPRSSWVVHEDDSAENIIRTFENVTEALASS